MTLNCAIEVQGSLVALANRSTHPAIPDAPSRGKVAGFSAASRLRLLRKMARVNAGSAVFLTLTFPDRYPDAPAAKACLRAFFERMRRRWPKYAAVWRMEAQRRGAPHFHLLIFGTTFIPIETIRQWWTEICAAYYDGTAIQIDIKRLRNARRVMAYVSKYAAKLEEHQYRSYDGGLFLDDGVYLHAGRQWGVYNSQALPVQVCVILSFERCPDALFGAMKDLMRSRWEYLNDMPDRGGVIFTADAYSLFAEAVKILENK